MWNSRIYAMILILAAFVCFSECSTARTLEPSTLGIGAGIAGIIDDHKIGIGSLEYRPSWIRYRISPWIGMEFGSDLFYLAGGLLTHLNLAERVVVTPSLGIGFYSSHSGIELGSRLEFRSSIELAYRLENNHRMGVSFGHISNGGLGEKNPGSEILKISYYFPV